MNEPRRHHLISKFYLDGFTRNGAGSGGLNVFDYSTGKRYRTTPSKACREADYFRIDNEDEDRQLMEKVLSVHESAVAPFVQQVAADGRISDKRQVGEALSLASVFAARSRRGRDRLETMIRPRVIKALREETVTEAEWERHRQLELQNGAAESDVPPYGQAREKAIAGGWMPRAPRAFIVGVIPEAADGIRELLSRLPWEAHTTDADANGGFITSDSPLVWGDLDEWIDGRQASLLDPGIEITFPVSKSVALVSHPDAKAGNAEARDEEVAHINSRTLHASMGIVMYGYDEFLLRRGNGDVQSSNDYFSYQDDARRRGILRP